MVLKCKTFLESADGSKFFAGDYVEVTFGKLWTITGQIQGIFKLSMFVYDPARPSSVAISYQDIVSIKGVKE